MADVLYALEIWTLISVLAAWCLCRAALALRRPPPRLDDLAIVVGVLGKEGARREQPLDADALSRARRLRERA